MKESLSNISVEERKEILSAYKSVLKANKDVLSNSEIKEVRKALEIILEKYGLNKRLSGRLSIVHSLDVGRIVLEEMGLGKASLISTLLYDTVTQAGINSYDFKAEFGDTVYSIIEGLTKVSALYDRNTAIESENFRKLLLSFAQDVRVILIIIADRLQTMRSLDLYSKENQLAIATEVSYLYAPMAHRLGLYSIKSEMEDLVMKFTDNDTYKFIARKLNETKRARDKYIDEFIEPLKKELEKQGLVFDIKGRTKTIHSINNKLKKQKVNFEQVYDLFAIRIILDSEPQNEKSDCWKAYSIVADKYQPNPRRMRDWLSVPKSNGYESLHTTVLGPQQKWVEVQIRTQRMDEVAEKGLAAHWKYKGGQADNRMDEWLGKIREILDNPELNAVDFIDDFKLNLYDEEVFVFTPKGDLIRLPKGATVLDFAFNIHSEVGKRCVGAVINGKNVSLRYKLQNGEHVEVTTSNNQTPKIDWLKIVVTSTAKTKLKQTLREIQYKESEIGKETLVRRLKNWKLELTDQLLAQLVKHYKYKTPHDFFRDIVLEKLDVIQIKEVILQFNKKEEELSEASNELRSAEGFKNISTQEFDEHTSSDVLVIDKNLNNVDYSLAKCCNPIFGDDIFGFVAVSGGIKIHRRNCPNAPDLRNRYGYRIVKATWTGEAGGSYLASIRVIGDDDIGIVTNISQVISKDLNLKVRSMNINSEEGLFEGVVTIFVNDNTSLNSIIKKIGAIKGVKTVSRIDFA